MQEVVVVCKKYLGKSMWARMEGPSACGTGGILSLIQAAKPRTGWHSQEISKSPGDTGFPTKAPKPRSFPSGRAGSLIQEEQRNSCIPALEPKDIQKTSWKTHMGRNGRAQGEFELQKPRRCWDSQESPKAQEMLGFLGKPQISGDAGISRKAPKPRRCWHSQECPTSQEMLSFPGKLQSPGHSGIPRKGWKQTQQPNQEHP